MTADGVPDDLAVALPRIAERCLTHEFDLLGSGWIEVRYGADCPGLEQHKYPAGPRITPDARGRWLSTIVNRSNQERAAKAWRLISRPDYRPIDWHLDFRSGHRWSGKDRFNEQRIGFPPGSDIKLPWELARMQHLPQLAVAAVLAASGPEGWRAPQRYTQELRNQIIDFYCANPPRFGPNWTCPMDIGIRAANWVVALDIAGNAGWLPDEPFRRLLVDSLYDHGRHILRHLEWSENGRSNHYLSDIAGLLFIAAYLPPTAETDAWLAFATSELVGETERQFHRDGANYEGSTSYHRLSGELSVFGAALIAGLAREGRAAFSIFDRAHLAGIRPPAPFRSAPAVRRRHPLPADGDRGRSSRRHRPVRGRRAAAGPSHRSDQATPIPGGFSNCIPFGMTMTMRTCSITAICLRRSTPCLISRPSVSAGWTPSLCVR